MQTQPETQVGLISGARQSILLEQDQIQPGVFLTGLAASNLHEVISFEAGIVITQIHPKPALPTGAVHTHSFTLMGNTGCACGLRRHPVAIWMSENRETPRTHIIAPVGPVVAPEKYAIYGVRTAEGGIRVIGRIPENGETNPTAAAQYPLFTRAIKLWSLPEHARRLLDEGESRGQLDPGTQSEDQ